MEMKSSEPLLLADLTTCCKYAVFVAALSTVELWTVCPSFFNLGIRALTTARLISLSRKPLYSAPYPAPVAVCPALILILMVHTSSLAYLATNETLVLSHGEVFHCIPYYFGVDVDKICKLWYNTLGSLTTSRLGRRSWGVSHQHRIGGLPFCILRCVCRNKTIWRQT